MQPLAGEEDRIKRIIAGLDELARAEALGRALSRQPIKLAHHLTEVMDKVRGSIHEKNIAFNLECEQALTLSADPDCLATIMTNLLENAAKSIKQNGTVTVNAVVEGDQVRLAVKDTGRGIKRKDMPHIFERFYRASGSGIGLGLTIAKALVDASGGTIEVQSTYGNGCLVTVSIPRKVEAGAA